MFIIDIAITKQGCVRAGAMQKTIALILLIITAMGPAGLAALGHITDLEIISGTYDFQADFIVIKALGTRHGVTWEVFCVWWAGIPLDIILHSPRVWI